MPPGLRDTLDYLRRDLCADVARWLCPRGRRCEEKRSCPRRLACALWCAKKRLFRWLARWVSPSVAALCVTIFGGLLIYASEGLLDYVASGCAQGEWQEAHLGRKLWFLPAIILAFLLSLWWGSRAVADAIDVDASAPEDAQDKLKYVQTLILPLSFIDENGPAHAFDEQARRNIANAIREHGWDFKKVLDPGTRVPNEGGHEGQGRAERFRNFPWQQQLRIVHKILEEQGENRRLTRIHVLPSTASDGQKEDFVNILAALLEKEGCAVLRKNCGNTQKEKEAPAITIICNHDDHRLAGLDYGDPAKLIKVTRAIIDEDLKRRKATREPRSWKIPFLPYEIRRHRDQPAPLAAIDITGGSRTFGAMGAILALDPRAIFVYVHDFGQNAQQPQNDQQPEVRSFDIHLNKVLFRS